MHACNRAVDDDVDDATLIWCITVCRLQVHALYLYVLPAAPQVELHAGAAWTAYNIVVGILQSRR